MVQFDSVSFRLPLGNELNLSKAVLGMWSEKGILGSGLADKVPGLVE